jgi:hypothetical protein
MRMQGTTISLAGKPSRNASRMKPSSPISPPRGCRIAARWARMLSPPTDRFAAAQMTMPAGAATATARPRTNSVRSRMERTSTCPTWGIR